LAVCASGDDDDDVLVSMSRFSVYLSI
jgi:hypothetical protein